MQYVVKAIVVGIANVVIGAFCGIILNITYTMMMQNSSLLGAIIFFAGCIVSAVYAFLVKKFVMGSELAALISLICLILGMWIGWNFNVYA